MGQPDHHAVAMLPRPRHGRCVRRHDRHDGGFVEGAGPGATCTLGVSLRESRCFGNEIADGRRAAPVHEKTPPLKAYLEISRHSAWFAFSFPLRRTCSSALCCW